MTDHLLAEELLAAFPLQQLGYALVSAGLPGDGTKLERVHRLLDAARSTGHDASIILNRFKAEGLRRVCSQYGIQAPTKELMVRGLSNLLAPEERSLSGHQAALTRPTLPAVLGHLQRLTLPWRLVRTEAEAEQAIARSLKRHFVGVSTQYSVGGYLGYRIDIDLGDGQVGVEVKLADAVRASSSEAYRTLGQAFVYDRRKYGGRVIVALVGPDSLRHEASLVEVSDLLRSVGVTVAYVILL